MIRDFLVGVINLWPLIAVALAILMAAWAIDLNDRLNRTADKLATAAQKVDDLKAENIRLGSLRLDLMQQLGKRPPVIALPSRSNAFLRVQREWEPRS